MTELCQCDLAGYCERRKASMPIIHFNRCRAGEVAVLDDFYAQSAVIVNQEKQPRISTGIGTKLAEIIKEKTGCDIPCGECRAEVERLNRMNSEEVLEDIDALAQSITRRSQTNSQKWYHKLLVAFLPEFVEYEIRKWIAEACEQSKKKSPE